MSPYCSAHDEWLIMKLCMYVGYHDANNVSNFGGDPIKFLKTFYSIIYAVLRTWRSIPAAVAKRPRADCSSMEGHTSLSKALVAYIGPIQSSSINYTGNKKIDLKSQTKFHLSINM